MDSLYLHALRILPGRIGSKTLERLVDHFGSGEYIWHASENDILFSSDIDPGIKDAIINGRKHIDPEKEWAKLAESNIAVLGKNDPLYPRLLRKIPDAPYILYTRGAYDWASDRPMIAVVGSRKHSPYGEQAAYHLANDLTRAGFVVVSGLAFGIDSLSHKAALEAQGETIGVLASGITDSDITPHSHVPLAKRVMEHGALVSEFPPGTAVMKGNFVTRNRIIAGLCLGSLVIEASEKSGSLITAELALDYNREVFAIPGSIFSPASAGTNSLIKKGAKIVSGVQDILEEFPKCNLQHLAKKTPNTGAPPGLSNEEKKILSFLSHEPLHVDKIIKATTLETATTNSLLILLEIKGLVRNIGGMNYIKL